MFDSYLKAVKAVKIFIIVHKKWLFLGGGVKLRPKLSVCFVHMFYYY